METVEDSQPLCEGTSELFSKAVRLQAEARAVVGRSRALPHRSNRVIELSRELNARLDAESGRGVH